MAAPHAAAPVPGPAVVAGQARGDPAWRADMTCSRRRRRCPRGPGGCMPQYELTPVSTRLRLIVTNQRPC